ncbi:MAG: iron ABC transporter permease [Rhodospirillales bacterium]|nr:iron ABC transporter permease [Rhodospirillales bacterium]
MRRAVWLPLGCGALLALAAFPPLIRLAAVTLSPASLAVLASPIARAALLHSVAMGIVSTVLAGVLGTVFAVLLTLTDLPARRTVAFLFLLLLIVPPQITAQAWIVLLGPSSPLLAPLGLAPRPGSEPLYGPGGVAFLLAVEQAPIVYLALRASLAAIPADLIEAAQAAGAGRARQIGLALELARPGLLGGLSLSFVAAIGNFGTPALLAIPGRYPMLTTLIYQRLTGFGLGSIGEAAALALLLALLALAGASGEALMARRRATAPGRVARLALGRWRRPAAAMVGMTLAGLLAAPLAALLLTALLPTLGVQPDAATLGLGNFRSILAAGATRRALLDSLVLALGAGVVLAALLVAVCHAARRARAARALLAALEVPYVVPGLVLAIGCILVFLRPIAGITLYNSLGIILVAYLARFAALARRPLGAVMATLDPALEEAAAAAGAAPLPRFATVILPLALPAAVSAATLVFLAAFNELTVSALLWSAGHETLGVAVFNLEQAGEATRAAALSVVAMVATVALMLGAGVALRGRRLLPWQA